MVDFYKALQLLFKLEFSSPKDALHKNPTEEEYTFMGIYERANPFWEGWSIIHNLMRTKDDVKAVSIRLYNDESIQRTVAKFYKDNFWDRMKLDELSSQHKANEIFIFAVNVGARIAVKTAQRVVGVSDDGIMGANSLRAINSYDEACFDKAYDRAELAYYNNLIENNPKFKIYANGWRARAEAV